MGGAECLGNFKEGQTVLARLMNSQIWYQLAGLWGEGLERDDGLCSP